MNGVFDALRTLERSLTYHARRHELIASNVANADTPGYRPLDIRFGDVFAEAEGLQTSDARHLGNAGGPSFRSFDDSAVEPGNDGNAVSLERQMAKLTANGVRFKAVAEMMSRRLGLLKYAASDGRQG